jgi:hypothetical protein
MREGTERATGVLWLIFGLRLAALEAELVYLSKELDRIEQRSGKCRKI